MVSAFFILHNRRFNIAITNYNSYLYCYFFTSHPTIQYLQAYYTPNNLKIIIMKKIHLLLVSIFMLGTSQSNAQCGADFQFNTNNLTVDFQDSSFYSPNWFINHEWRFGDANIGFGTNPVHAYASAGTYRTLLIISDSLFSCYDTISKIVTVTGGTTPTPCNTRFTYNVTPKTQ